MELQIHAVRLRSWPQEELRECYNMKLAFDRSGRLKMMVQCRDPLMKCYSLGVLQSGQGDFEVISAGILRRELLPPTPQLNHV